MLPGDELIPTIAQCCPLIESIPTERWSLTDVGLNILANIPTLRELKLTSDVCTSAAAQRLIEAHPNLTLISLEGKDLDDALVNCIGRHCGNLRSLKLYKSRSSFLSDDTLQELFRGCPLLESFNLEQPRRISNLT